MAAITISTTLPIIEAGNLPLPIITDRLIIRPLLVSDIEAYHSLRSQPEAMAYSNRCRPDANMNETKARLEELKVPCQNSLAYYGIFLKKSDGCEGELIGDGGMCDFVSDHTRWPMFGYKFKKEYWGQGYATEFATAFMQFWWSLPRTNTRIKVASCSVDPYDTTAELMYAWTTKDNRASQRVLEKVGFKSFDGLDNELVNWRMRNSFSDIK